MLSLSTLLIQDDLPSAMKLKFALYWVHLNESSTILGLFDPRNKLSTYDVNEHEHAISKLHEMYENYKPVEENNLLVLPATKSTCDLFRNLTNCRQVNKNQCEITTYLSESETEAEPLL
ncbi:4935_t:CDS:2 [Cetraspora pellucida]|uniref:4935_t:CDS:1 n=1 Tax=Cetraspora pellucida TaxID=1433469 RepID=A0A9N9EPY1_9GLOM|nr:4935_t:CDS:2 [Cetraspora pellucida]